MLRFVTAVLSFLTLGFAATAYATPTVFRGVDDVCGQEIVKAVTKSAAARYSPETMETFSVVDVQLDKDASKKFAFLRLFTVSSSDEVGKSLWLVVTDDEDCLIEYVGVGTEE